MNNEKFIKNGDLVKIGGSWINPMKIVSIVGVDGMPEGTTDVTLEVGSKVVGLIFDPNTSRLLEEYLTATGTEMVI